MNEDVEEHEKFRRIKTKDSIFKRLYRMNCDSLFTKSFRYNKKDEFMDIVSQTKYKRSS